MQHRARPDFYVSGNSLALKNSFQNLQGYIPDPLSRIRRDRHSGGDAGFKQFGDLIKKKELSSLLHRREFGKIVGPCTTVNCCIPIHKTRFRLAYALSRPAKKA